MQSGIIQHTFEYYTSSPNFKDEIERGLLYFFNLKSLQDLAGLNISSQEMAWFNDWFTFDFVFKNGKTSLENFYQINPYNFSSEKLQIYQDLQTNEFGLFEVLKVDQGKGLMLQSLQTARVYYVQEKSATYQLDPGDYFFSRVGRVENHFELVGADSIKWSGVNFDQSIKNYLLQLPDKLTPKTVSDCFGPRAESLEDQNPLYEKMDIEALREKLRRALKHYELDQYVNVEIIEQWIKNLADEDYDFSFISMLVGLLEAKYSPEQAVDLFDLVIALHNRTAQYRLGDASPAEKMESLLPKDRQMNMARIPVGIDKSYDFWKKAMCFMKSGKYDKALPQFNKCFEALLEERTTQAEIYRVFANKALSHFAVGEPALGKKMLDIALKLNPNYDFAQIQLKRYKNGDFRANTLPGQLRKLQKKLVRAAQVEQKPDEDPAVRYYKYLRKFKINFKTKKRTKSRITYQNKLGKKIKIGRNSPCPCGARNKSGQSIKYKDCCFLKKRGK
ncbi:MAG: SEC-C domain-containing protein [Patescibacteria group bacterium]